MTAYTEVAGGDPIYAVTVNDLIRSTINKPHVRLVQSVAQTGVASNVATVTTFSTEVYDDFGYHSTSSNTGRITPTKAGVYTFSGGVCFQNRTDWELLFCYIRLNGTTELAPAGREAIGANSGSRTHEVLCGPVQQEMNGTTDYVELVFLAINTAAATFNTIVSASQASALHAEYMRGPR